MEDVTVVMVTEEGAKWHPTKVDKYFRVVEILNGAYRIVDCNGNQYDVYSADFKMFIWREKDWIDYCKPKMAL